MRPQRSSFLDLEGPDEDEPGSSITHSILGLDREAGRRPPSRPPVPETKAPDPKTPDARAPDTSAPEAKDELSPQLDVPVPEFERDLEEGGKRPIPFERAVLFSLAAHIAFLLFLIFVPASTLKGRGLLAAFFPPPEDNQDKIPIVFREAPGPARENPRRSEPSDKTRRAGGGDPSRPKADTPFVPQRNGAEGLAPGASRQSPPAIAQRQIQPNPGNDRTAAAAPGEKFPPAPDAFQVPPPGSASSGPDARQLAGLDRAIRDAAKAVGSTGQGGAGSPNPDGGFVDSGPLSFDTSWYDWGPYAEEMVRRIKLHWEIPELARIGMKGRLTIRFYIMADGRVEGAHIVARSGTPPFDFAALQAILKSDPFRPLPKDLLAQVPGKDREGITVTFFYNMRPEEVNK